MKPFMKIMAAIAALCVAVAAVLYIDGLNSTEYEYLENRAPTVIRIPVGGSHTFTVQASESELDALDRTGCTNVSVVYADAAEAGVRVKGRMAELVILFALFFVREHLVGFIGLFEALFRGLVARMQIRMVLLGDLAVCFFYFICRGVLFDAQHFIVISFFSHAILQISFKS